MKEAPPPSTRSRALGCILINVAAFPGLGSILMGRRVGWVQAPMMLVGFILGMGFGLRYLWSAVEMVQHPAWTAEDVAAQYRPYLWALRCGLGLCALAWLWAMISCVDIWRKEGQEGSQRRIANSR